uniref:Adenosine deaminase domain-containing protein n=1 Tax=Globisporangium ultimum (strain ATCC 200006 / CBS 805.95 / DAOM BR144) TaxID=431595 RepID=K3WPU6_GLOUD
MTAKEHDTPTLSWCEQLPKVELHAHIHGSIRTTTLQEILLEDAQLHGTAPRSLPPNRSLDECFEMFHLIHQVVVSRAVLRRITIEAVEDFAKANVKYLELRSTPRALERDGASRADYVAEVVSALEECHAREDLDIEVRLLLSINRNQPLEIAKETVNMALEWKQKSPYIVGIDLSGHSERPNSEFHLFENTLDDARAGGLKLALHFAEHFDDDESDRILTFRPDRLGHACCLPDNLYQRMISLRIPIEMCLTSNVHTLARYRSECPCASKDSSGLCICGYKAHPHARVLMGELGETPTGCYPLCICTDDQGVLDTTLPREYMRTVEAFDLSKTRLRELARAAIPTIFDTTQQARLVAIMDRFETQNQR